MWTSIGSGSTVPNYEKIIAQVVGVIASGGLKPGDMLPSVREMAGKLLVNPDTVARAYGELERAGLGENRDWHPASLRCDGSQSHFSGSGGALALAAVRRSRVHIRHEDHAAQAGDRLNEVASEMLSLSDSAVFVHIRPRMGEVAEGLSVAPAPMGRPALNVFQDALKHAFTKDREDIRPEVRRAKHPASFVIRS